MSDIYDELRRKARVADMMLSMHAILRDRYARRATSLDMTIFAAATLLSATTFLDPAVIIDRGWKPETVRLIMGLCSLTLFFLSILVLIVDWKQKATRHQYACRNLSDIKAKARELLAKSQHLDVNSVEDFLRTSAFVMSELPPIPDTQFGPLKAKHKRKLAMSEMLDAHPTAPLWLLKAKLSLLGIKDVFTSRTERGNHSA